MSVVVIFNIKLDFNQAEAFPISLLQAALTKPQDFPSPSPLCTALSTSIITPQRLLIPMC